MTCAPPLASSLYDMLPSPLKALIILARAAFLTPVISNAVRYPMISPARFITYVPLASIIFLPISAILSDPALIRRPPIALAPAPNTGLTIFCSSPCIIFCDA